MTMILPILIKQFTRFAMSSQNGKVSSVVLDSWVTPFQIKGIHALYFISVRIKLPDIKLQVSSRKANSSQVFHAQRYFQVASLSLYEQQRVYLAETQKHNSIK